MASKINVIISLTEFWMYSEELREKFQIFGYIEERSVSFGKRITEISDNEGLEALSSPHYSGIFLSSEKLSINNELSFYADGVFEYCIEITGGKETDAEIEIAHLRLIAKKPDKQIKSFFTALTGKLKIDEAFGSEIYSGSGALYKNAFYKKDLVGKKSMWSDFARKDKPIQTHI